MNLRDDITDGSLPGSNARNKNAARDSYRRHFSYMLLRAFLPLSLRTHFSQLSFILFIDFLFV